MNDSFDVSTIVFALLAIFVVWKLRSVLGTRTGTEAPPPAELRRKRPLPGAPAESQAESNVTPFPGAANDQGSRAANPDRWTKFAEPGSRVWAGLDELVAADATFEPKSFLEGARGAYEMIISAFAAGDRQSLKNLLAKDVFDSFAGAITERESRGERVETTFVSLDKSSFEDVQLKGRTAQVAVRFQSKQITATRDKSGAVIDGSPDQVVDMVDIWTFAREAGARDPNWKLVATESGH